MPMEGARQKAGTLEDACRIVYLILSVSRHSLLHRFSTRLYPDSRYAFLSRLLSPLHLTRFAPVKPSPPSATMSDDSLVKSVLDRGLLVSSSKQTEHQRSGWEEPIPTIPESHTSWTKLFTEGDVVSHSTLEMRDKLADHRIDAWWFYGALQPILLREPDASTREPSFVKRMKMFERSTMVLMGMFLAVVLASYNEEKGLAPPLIYFLDATRHHISFGQVKVEFHTDGGIYSLARSGGRATRGSFDYHLILIKWKGTDLGSACLPQIFGEALACVQSRVKLADGLPLSQKRLRIFLIIMRQMSTRIISFHFNSEYLQWVEVPSTPPQDAPKVEIREAEPMNLATGEGRLLAVQRVWGVLDSVL
ncbi:hypothetical protein EJ06DRAFT_130656 [Trichodelitschia bisporula]|uniref:Uncharacterized protein n=1 Tax=Trichodelitschia bisporula TaxID=703511 RepID=A0A6G1HP91_9PEZI|nr:hypothetical protein EJ06DRAFT_130656 [Trichodelitschia bisporula]